MCNLWSLHLKSIVCLSDRIQLCPILKTDIRFESHHVTSRFFILTETIPLLTQREGRWIELSAALPSVSHSTNASRASGSFQWRIFAFSLPVLGPLWLWTEKYPVCAEDSWVSEKSSAGRQWAKHGHERTTRHEPFQTGKYELRSGVHFASTQWKYLPCQLCIVNQGLREREREGFCSKFPIQFTLKKFFLS